MKKPASSKGKMLAVQKTNGTAAKKNNPGKGRSNPQSSKSASNGLSAHAEKNEKKKMAAMSLDEFINSSVDSEELDSEAEDEELEDEDDELDNEEDSEGEEEEEDDEEGDDEEGSDEEAEDNEDGDSDENGEDNPKSAAKKHKMALAKLKESDPEFYQFLSENDRELLEFDTSDSEDEERGGEVHKPPRPDELEVGSDESDFEDEELAAKRKSNVVTQSMVDEWQQKLQNPKCIKTIVDVVSAFRSAVHSVTEEKEGITRFKVQGGASFNAVVRLCIVDLIPAVKRYLKIKPDEKVNVERCKSWVKLRTHMKSYLADVIRLLASLTESSLQSVTLKHIHQLIPFYAAFIKLARVLTKRLVTVWCSGEDTIRVLAFLSLLRLSRTLPAQLLEPIIKAMYLSYARNCKFTSPSTWPVINFMRRSLVEVMALQESLTYKHAFLYIRQLAIHLRNAITLKKKDSLATVYNWQFVHCLHLWAALLGTLPDSPLMKPLVYPLVQIAIGTINLVPTARYYPLRFHIVSILNQLSADTSTYIPVLPFLLEVMQHHKFDKKPGKMSMKPLDVSCVLRVSQSQMAESGYRDAVVDLLYDGLLDVLQAQSHSSAFPEVALPAILQIKQFIKKCPQANYTKKMKQLVDKIQENVKFVEKHREGVHFELADTQAVLALENQIKAAGTPLTSYHTNWKKMRDREMAIKIAKKPDNDREVNVPVVKRPAAKKSKEDEDASDDDDNDGDDDDDDGKGDFDDLFPSDLSDDDDDEERFLLKEERGKKRKPDDEEEDEQLLVKKKTTTKTKKETVEEKKKKATTTAPAAKKAKAAAVEEEEDDDDESDGQDAGDEVVDFDMSSGDEAEDAEDDDDDEEDSAGSEAEEDSDESYDQDDD